MSSFNCWSFGSGKSNNSEDGVFWNEVQKEELKEMMMHIMHHELKPEIESLVRTIAREEVRNLFNGLDRNSGNQGHTCERRCLKLQFLKDVSLPILTNEEIQGEGSFSIQVALIDNLDARVVDSGPEASAKVEIVALEGDIGGTEGDDWTSEEFNRKIVREREGVYSKGKKKKKKEGKKPLLDGNVHLHLNKGIGVVGKIKFRQYTRWMKNHKFKLGARVIDSFSGFRIKEAVTKPFIVKDRRTKCERKHGCPSLSDDVSKLKNIRKDSKRHKHLQEKNIKTVEDFLIQLFRNPEHLQQILGLEANLWEATVNHARKCAINKRIWYYYSSQEKIGVVFDVIKQVLGLIQGYKYTPIEDLSKKDKADAHFLAITAFDHRQDVLHFHDINSVIEYIHCLSLSELTSKPAELHIRFGDYPSFGNICPSIDSSRQGSNVEDVDLFFADNVEQTQELHFGLSGDDRSGSMDTLMEIVENYFRQQSQSKEAAKRSWKKLSLVVRILMKKW